MYRKAIGYNKFRQVLSPNQITFETQTKSRELTNIIFIVRFTKIIAFRSSHFHLPILFQKKIFYNKNLDPDWSGGGARSMHHYLLKVNRPQQYY